MARITVATSHPPFAEGGHLVIARALVSVLRDAGHEAVLVLTPQNRFGRQGAAYAATWLTDVGLTHDDRPVDQLISLRYPSYALRHPVHVCWLNHRMREYYDQWAGFAAGLSWRGRAKERVRRRLVHAADGYLLRRRVTRLCAQSRTIQRRLERWGGLTSTVVYPPAPPRDYRCEAYGPSVLVISRLTRLKRVGLILRALARPPASGVRLRVVGGGPEAASLRDLARELGVGDRVTWLGAVDDDVMLDELARCRAVCFPPVAEDFGLVTVEAFASGRGVVTCEDSGGPAELVQDGVSGVVTRPDPESLAEALGRLTDDPAWAERLGQGAAARSAELSWERALSALLLVS